MELLGGVKGRGGGCNFIGDSRPPAALWKWVAPNRWGYRPPVSRGSLCASVQRGPTGLGGAAIRRLRARFGRLQGADGRRSVPLRGRPATALSRLHGEKRLVSEGSFLMAPRCSTDWLLGCVARVAECLRKRKVDARTLPNTNSTPIGRRCTTAVTAPH